MMSCCMPQVFKVSQLHLHIRMRIHDTKTALQISLNLFNIIKGLLAFDFP